MQEFRGPPRHANKSKDHDVSEISLLHLYCANSAVHSILRALDGSVLAFGTVPTISSLQINTRMAFVFPPSGKIERAPRRATAFSCTVDMAWFRSKVSGAEPEFGTATGEARVHYCFSAILSWPPALVS